MRFVALLIAALLWPDRVPAAELVAVPAQGEQTTDPGDSALALQEQIQAVHATAMQTTVAIYGRRRGDRPRGSGASGVVVSADGQVLTAAHVLESVGARPIVRMPDGRLLDAVSLGRDDGADFGLIQIEADVEHAYAEIGSSEALVRDEVCLMYGHPGGVSEDRPAVLRLGVFLGFRRDGMLRTSCKMMPGDSGGPVFDLDGRVVGINSQIRLRLDQNYHVAVDYALVSWQRLLDGEEWHSHRNDRELPEGPAPTESQDDADEADVLAGGVSSLQAAFANGAAALNASIIRLEDSAGVSLGLCVAISEDHLLAKSSRLHADEVQIVLIDTAEGGLEERAAGRVIARDESTDLALIEVVDVNCTPVEFGDEEVLSGALLGTVGPGGTVLHVGVAGSPARKVRQPDYGILGVRLDQDEDDGRVEFETAFEEAPAYNAGLRGGDVLVEFDGTAYTSERAFRSVLRRTLPGQNVTIKVTGGDGEERLLEFALGSSGQSQASSGSRRTHVAYRTEVSLRRGGFPLAQRHDMPLDVESCATPVVDLAGRVIGINAARYDRTASLVLPASTVLSAIARLEKIAQTRD